MPLVLVVDDDPTVREVLATYLADSGLEVVQAQDGQSALDAAANATPDLVVLDRMLPGLDGLEVLRRLRANRGDLPVILLTARGEEEDRVLGLQVGADDYVAKPFSPRELVLRVHSLLRRAASKSAEPVAGRLFDGDLMLDCAARRATLGGRPLALPNREFDLLEHFVRHPGRAFTRADLLERVWDWRFGDETTVTVHVRRLRGKVEPVPSVPRRIVTVWGVGYRWEPSEARR